MWAGGRRVTYEVTVTAQELKRLPAKCCEPRSPFPSVQVVPFDHSIVVRGTVNDGAQFAANQRYHRTVHAHHIAAGRGPKGRRRQRRDDLAKPKRSSARDRRHSRKLPIFALTRTVKGNVIVSGNATDAVTAQAILDRARGLAGPYLASNGQLIDRLNSLNNSQIDIKVYVLEVDKTASSNLGLQLFAALPVAGQLTPSLISPAFPFIEAPAGPGKGFTISPFYRTTTLAPTLNLMMQEGHVKTLSSPNLVTSPGNKASFLVGGSILVVTTTGLGSVNVQYQPYGVQLNVTPRILGNGSIKRPSHPTSRRSITPTPSRFQDF